MQFDQALIAEKLNILSYHTSTLTHTRATWTTDDRNLSSSYHHYATLEDASNMSSPSVSGILSVLRGRLVPSNTSDTVIYGGSLPKPINAKQLEDKTRRGFSDASRNQCSSQLGWVRDVTPLPDLVKYRAKAFQMQAQLIAEGRHPSRPIRELSLQEVYTNYEELDHTNLDPRYSSCKSLCRRVRAT